MQALTKKRPAETGRSTFPGDTGKFNQVASHSVNPEYRFSGFSVNVLCIVEQPAEKLNYR
jgi:hypothetical protein